MGEVGEGGGSRGGIGHRDVEWEGWRCTGWWDAGLIVDGPPLQAVLGMVPIPQQAEDDMGVVQMQVCYSERAPHPTSPPSSSSHHLTHDYHSLTKNSHSLTKTSQKNQPYFTQSNPTSLLLTQNSLRHSPH